MGKLPTLTQAAQDAACETNQQPATDAAADTQTETNQQPATDAAADTQTETNQQPATDAAADTPTGPAAQSCDKNDPAFQQVLEELGAGDVFGNAQGCELYLQDKQITNLPKGVFDRLTLLTQLYLDNNQIT